MNQETSDEEGDSCRNTEQFGTPADWLRSFKGCKHYSDEEADMIIESLNQLAVILFDYTSLNVGTDIDNQIIINKSSNENQNFAA